MSAVQFVRAFFDAGKPVAVICHDPWTLIDAGVVKGALDRVGAVVSSIGRSWYHRDHPPATPGRR